MSDCVHPFDSVSEDYAILRLTEGKIERAEPSDKELNDDIRVPVQYCEDCNEVVKSESFDAGFPIDHLNELITNDDTEDCKHGYDFITNDTLTFQLENGVVTTQQNLSVIHCEECNKIVDVNDSVSTLQLKTV